MTTTIEKSDTFDTMLEKHELYKFLRIIAWIKRFLNNCQKSKRNGPLKTTNQSIRRNSGLKEKNRE